MEQRGVYLRKVADLFLEHNDELARLETLCTGRPISIFFDGKLAADNFRWFADYAWNVQGTASTNTPGLLSMTVKEPYGPVGLIIPWNFPLAMFSIKIASALAAGNTVVLKSSEKAPLTVSRHSPRTPAESMLMINSPYSQPNSLKRPASHPAWSTLSPATEVPPARHWHRTWISAASASPARL